MGKNISSCLLVRVEKSARVKLEFIAILEIHVFLLLTRKKGHGGDFWQIPHAVFHLISFFFTYLLLHSNMWKVKSIRVHKTIDLPFKAKQSSPSSRVSISKRKHKYSAKSAFYTIQAPPCVRPLNPPTTKKNEVYHSTRPTLRRSWSLVRCSPLCWWRLGFGFELRMQAYVGTSLSVYVNDRDERKLLTKKCMKPFSNHARTVIAVVTYASLGSALKFAELRKLCQHSS